MIIIIIIISVNIYSEKYFVFWVALDDNELVQMCVLYESFGKATTTNFTYLYLYTVSKYNTLFFFSAHTYNDVK